MMKGNDEWRTKRQHETQRAVAAAEAAKQRERVT